MIITIQRENIMKNIYTSQQKINAVILMMENKWNATQAGRELGINSTQLAYWYVELVTEYLKAPQERLTGLKAILCAIVDKKDIQKKTTSYWTTIGHSHLDIKSFEKLYEEGKIRVKPQQIIDIEKQLEELNQIIE